jgi:hypothetical protein
METTILGEGGNGTSGLMGSLSNACALGASASAEELRNHRIALGMTEAEAAKHISSKPYRLPVDDARLRRLEWAWKGGLKVEAARLAGVELEQVILLLGCRPLIREGNSFGPSPRDAYRAYP